MRDIVLRHVPADRPVRLLDLGCGTGSLAFRLAEALPNAIVTGIDVSSANIREASERLRERALARLRFEAADYLTYRDEPFDAIVADGVLHLIGGDTDVLLRKVADDLRAGGRFICSMPFDCVYNRVFGVVRSLLRAVRSPATDRAILQIARWVHGRDMDDAALRQRVGYMYFPPVRMMGNSLAARFESVGLTKIAGREMPSTSPSQLKHDVTVWTRTASGA